MEPKIHQIWKQALITFGKGKRYPAFRDNFRKLQSLANTITAEDIKLDLSLLEWKTQLQGCESTESVTEAPISYMAIHDDDELTIGVFIVKNGSRIPLHDHPNMHGIIKVLAGNIHVQSYTLIPTISIENLKTMTDVDDNTIIVEKLPPVIADAHSPACVLTPQIGNYHEIQSCDGPGAFLDILSPPYDRDPENYDNACHYFEEVTLEDRMNLLKRNDIVALNTIPAPLEYWTDRAGYEGPPLE